MSQSPDSNVNPQTQQTHSGSGDNVNRDKNTTSYYSEIGGDFKGIQGDILGGVINQYIITQQSSVEIQQRELKKGSPYKGLEKFRVEDKDKFFGREDWSKKLTDYLQNNSVLLLLGASGSGKSSWEQVNFVSSLALRLVEWAKHIIFLMVSKVFQALPTLRLRVLVYLFLQN